MERTLSQYTESQLKALQTTQCKQLKRELSCLERQLERLKRFGHIEAKTIHTYQDMIASRYRLLEHIDARQMPHTAIQA